MERIARRAISRQLFTFTMKLTIKTTLATLLLGMFCSSAFAKHEKKHPDNVVDWKTVPAAAQSAIQSNANGGKVTEVTKELKNGVTVYRAEVKEEAGKMFKVAVTDTGTLLKVKEDTAKNKRKHKPLFGS
jgi:hypothetical protein